MPALLGQQRPSGPPDDGESPAQPQLWKGEGHPNEALAAQLSQAQAESPHPWISENAQGHYLRLQPLYHSPVYAQSGFVPAPLGQQRLPNPPDDGESPAHLQVLPTQVHPNNALASQLSHAHAESPHLWMSENAQDYYQRLHSLYTAPIHVQSRFVPVTLGHWQHLPSPPDNGGSPAQPQCWEGEVHPNDASRLSPHGPAQLTGSALEQPPGAAQSTGAREAEPQRRSSTAGEQYSCKRCVKIFQRSQELVRHIREVHDSNSPRKCPFCPRFRRPWKRPYLMKKHLINDHREEFAEDVLEHVRALKGKDVFAFVDTVTKYLRASTVINVSPHESTMGAVGDNDEGRIEEN